MTDRIEAIRERYSNAASEWVREDVAWLLAEVERRDKALDEVWALADEWVLSSVTACGPDPDRHGDNCGDCSGHKYAREVRDAFAHFAAPVAPEAEPTEWEWTKGDVVLWCDGDVWQRGYDPDAGVWYDTDSNHVLDEQVTAEVTKHGGRVLVCKARGIGVGGAS